MRDYKLSVYAKVGVPVGAYHPSRPDDIARPTEPETKLAPNIFPYFRPSFYTKSDNSVVHTDVAEVSKLLWGIFPYNQSENYAHQYCVNLEKAVAVVAQAQANLTISSLSNTNVSLGF